jgi:hypothetical protein
MRKEFLAAMTGRIERQAAEGDGRNIPCGIRRSGFESAGCAAKAG